MNSFTCELLYNLKASTGHPLPSTLSPSSLPSNPLNAITALYYVPDRSQVVVTTADHNIITCSVSSDAENDRPSRELLDKSSGTITETGLQVTRTIVGSHDDILDMVAIPAYQSSSTSADNAGDNTNESKGWSGRIALVSNSTQVRIVKTDDMTCTSLEGHSDIILCVDVSPDG